MALRRVLLCVSVGAVVAVAVSACRLSSTKRDKSPDQVFVKSFTGYDSKGYARSCVVDTELDACPALGAKEAAFIVQCKDAGFTSQRCDCTLVLCSNKSRTPSENQKE